ncbi:GNAT family N-acetyltransferase [uncultured Duncaniella sp.]|uniref:GNAT family N-acetyltransferase n=1 Tax=uncultured Duncaniella sp. TaxID=2768039 RepID=UPI0025A97EB5|nr:GNAT family N-acetyltransferase [uncultured Duncaniella sp.]
METPLLVAPRFDMMPLRQKDAGAIFTRWMTDRDVARFTTWCPQKDVQETHAWVATDIQRNQTDDYFSWGMYFDDFTYGHNRPRIFGHITLQVHQDSNVGTIGYNIMRSEWGKGLTTEAVQAVLNFAFCRLNLAVVSAAIHVDNAGSCRVAEKVGMLRQYTFRMPWKDGKEAPMLRYSITKEQFLS